MPGGTTGSILETSQERAPLNEGRGGSSNSSSASVKSVERAVPVGFRDDDGWGLVEASLSIEVERKQGVRREAPQHSTAQHSTAQHSTAQHSTAQHSTAQHSTGPVASVLQQLVLFEEKLHPQLAHSKVAPERGHRRPSPRCQKVQVFQVPKSNQAVGAGGDRGNLRHVGLKPHKDAL